MALLLPSLCLWFFVMEWCNGVVIVGTKSNEHKKMEYVLCYCRRTR